MADDRIPWIDLSDYGITLHAVRLSSGRVALVAAGATAVHGAALAALGFRRTRQGHVVHPESTLKLRAVRVHFPAARVRDLARAAVARIVPSAPASAAGATDHLIHNATLLGVNRRGQQVYADGADHRYLVGTAEGDDGPLADSDYLRLTAPDRLPEVVAGLIHRAEQEEKLAADALEQLARAIAVPPGQPAPSRHALQEALEAATVRHVRERAGWKHDTAWRAGAPLPAAAFRAAQRLADHLPAAAARAGETLAWAQFSTPLPLAVVARTLLGPLGTDRSLLEPTAGHGALLLGLPADTRITAVEIDPDRARRLEQVLRAGNGGSPPARVVTGDILRLPPGAAPYDYILANPPYGRLAQHRPDEGPSTRVRFGAVSFPTRRLDHRILLETLQHRHPLGRAVYLIGADHPRDHALDTPAGGSRYLLNLLGDRYHVEAVIGLHGDLYGGQGAHYPLRLVVVGEQGTGFPPVPETTPTARTWDELWTLVETLAPRLGPSALERAAPVAVSSGPGGAPPPAPAPEDEAEAEAEAEAVVFQERYRARSRLGEASTMIPANMAAAVRRALDRVEAGQGCDVDEAVGRALGLSATELAQRFAPEQIDALALIFHAHDRGRGFIAADETGIGKGRVLAGVCLRAWRAGRPVIFLTEKPNLFSDFYRDLRHVGARHAIVPLIVNRNTPLKDTEHGDVLVPASRPGDLQRALAADDLPPGVNLVLVTYSQLCQPISPKTDWLCRIARRTGAQVLVDESHNASGESTTAANVRRLLEASGRPPVFSSATYAKRPDNLALYGPVLPALFRQDDLGSLLRQGGAPLQEVFSQMLAEDGVLVRREHDLSNITFRTEPDGARAARNRDLADRLASILEKMAWLGGDIEAFLSRENQRLNELLQPGAASGERTGHRAGLHSMNFGSRLYQLNRLFLLALKVEHAIEFGAGEIEAGRKPVFVVENTLETLLKEIITNQFDDALERADEDRDGAEHPAGDPEATAGAGTPFPGGNPFVGQEFPPMTYRDALRRVLGRMMQYTTRDRYGNPARRAIGDESLIALAQDIERDIDAFPDLPLSPLDSVRLALAARGYRIGELSGRSFQVEWIERADRRAMRVRPRPAENRVDLILRFNTDVYQGLIVTRSGSTGLSAHARADVPGWSPAPRSMFELQIPQNVAERIQFWGRINRRGQCAAPTVVTPSTELPGEVRLIAMQNAKLRQLSANTTSNQDNAALAKHVPDLLNPLGNQIARRWIRQNPFQSARLSAEITDERDAAPEWYVNRITSRILLLPVAEQEAVLEELAGLYRSHLDELTSQGIQPLRTAECDWKAREVARATFENTPAGAEGADGPFHAPIDFVTVEYDQARRPLRAAQVEAAVAEGARIWRPGALLEAFGQVKTARLAQAITPTGRYAGFPSVEDGLNAPGADNPVQRTARQLGRIEDFLHTVAIGAVVDWQVPGPATTAPTEAAEAPERETRRGLIVGVRPPPPEGLHLTGHYEITLAVPGEERFKTVTLHSLLKGDYTLHRDAAERRTLLAAFDAAASGTVARRQNLLVGNLYAALQIAERDDLGRPVIYTTADGARERGILLHADWTLEVLQSKPVLLRAPEHLYRFVEDHRQVPRAVLVSSDTGGRPECYKRGLDFVLVLNAGDVHLSVPGAHARNGPLLHDARWQALAIALEGNRTVLEGPIPPSALPGALDVLGRLKSWYVAHHYRDWYNQLTNGATDPQTAPPTPPAPETDSAEEPPVPTRRVTLAPGGSTYA